MRIFQEPAGFIVLVALLAAIVGALVQPPIRMTVDMDRLQHLPLQEALDRIRGDVARGQPVSTYEMAQLAFQRSREQIAEDLQILADEQVPLFLNQESRWLLLTSCTLALAGLLVVGAKGPDERWALWVALGGSGVCLLCVGFLHYVGNHSGLVDEFNARTAMMMPSGYFVVAPYTDGRFPIGFTVPAFGAAVAFITLFLYLRRIEEYKQREIAASQITHIELGLSQPKPAAPAPEPASTSTAAPEESEAHTSSQSEALTPPPSPSPSLASRGVRCYGWPPPDEDLPPEPKVDAPSQVESHDATAT